VLSTCGLFSFHLFARYIGNYAVLSTAGTPKSVLMGNKRSLYGGSLCECRLTETNLVAGAGIG
jgi:hypothetical protein